MSVWISLAPFCHCVNYVEGMISTGALGVLCWRKIYSVKMEYEYILSLSLTGYVMVFFCQTAQ